MSTTYHKSGLTKRKASVIFTITILAFFAVIFTISLSLSDAAGQLPRLVTGLGLILTILSLVSQIKDLVKGNSDEIEEVVKGLKWYFIALIAVTYLAGLVVLGFIISTLIFLFLVPVILKHRKWKVNFIFSLVTTFVLYLCFVYIFSVRLPQGLIFSSLLGG